MIQSGIGHRWASQDQGIQKIEPFLFKLAVATLAKRNHSLGS